LPYFVIGQFLFLTVSPPPVPLQRGTGGGLVSKIVLCLVWQANRQFVNPHTKDFGMGVK